MKDLSAALQQRQMAQLYRRPRIATRDANGGLHLDGRPVIDFSSNDYLGLSQDKRVQKAFITAARHWGVGARAAHLLGGHTQAHHALEEALAAATGYARALLFSTGYMANIGIIQALLSPNDAVYQDRLNHASLLDGGRLSGARLRRYRHAEPAALAALLTKCTAQQRLIASDGVFSMDGDLAPLPNLVRLAKQYSAWLLLDDAHGFGVLGEQGGGSLEHHGLGPDDVPILMGTLGKALGGFGAFVAGSEALIETLIQQARSYIYTTAAPPAVAAACHKALQLMQAEPWRRHQIKDHIARFRLGAQQLGLPLMNSQTPIQPLLLGDVGRVTQLSDYLYARGFWVGAIRPPTVPPAAARLRITLTAQHSPEQIDALLQALADYRHP